VHHNEDVEGAKKKHPKQTKKGQSKERNFSRWIDEQILSE
jgi:hypothetical protein